jgi:hypothetical protein
LEREDDPFMIKKKCMLISIIILFLLFFPISVHSKPISWEDLENGYPLKVRGWHDKLKSIVIYSENYQLSPTTEYFVLDKDVDTNNPFKVDKWILKLKNSIIKLKTIKINLVFHGKNLVPVPPITTSITLEVNSICDDIYKILFEEINDQLTNRINAITPSTDKTITLEGLYFKLRKGKLRDYINNIEKLREDTIQSQCETNIYHLMKFIKNEEKYGFETASWELPQTILSYLDNISEVLNNYSEKNKLLNATIFIIGYADPRNIPSYTQIPLPSNMVLRIDEETCPDDKTKGHPTPIHENDDQFPRIKDRIINNCQLSAARAKAALDYLKPKLKNINGLRYTYAAGGIKDNSEEEMPENRRGDGDIPEHRSISVRIHIEAAK